MKYTNKITVELPLDAFTEKMDNPENLKHWMKGLESYKQLEGKPGEVGAKMQFNFNHKNRKMEMVETITHRKMPHEFHATYETKGMVNTLENYFEETKDGHTIWTSHSEFIPGNFMMKLMTALMKGSFKKQSQKFMNNFKNFAENNVSVNQN